MPRGCGLRWACTYCRRAYYSRVRERLAWALAQNPRGTLQTVGVPHSGALETDERRLKRAWIRWRAHAQKHYRRSWPYVGVYEITASDAGHTHAHLIYHEPHTFQPWSLWRRWWVLALPGLQWISLRRLYGTPAQQAGYLAKYLSKGIEPNTLTPKRAAELLHAWRGKRVITASRGYFCGAPRRCCPLCGGRSTPGTLYDAVLADCSATIKE